MIGGLLGPELLTADHDVSQFDCGKRPLTDWLHRWALENQRNDSARVYVVHRSGRVVGYYALTTGSIAKDDAPRRVGAGLAAHPVPVIILARLGVDLTEQGRGLGKALVLHAMRQAASAADVIAARALLIHAQDDDVLSFYEPFEMEPSPTDPLDLLILMKDLRATLAAAAADVQESGA